MELESLLDLKRVISAVHGGVLLVAEMQLKMLIVNDVHKVLPQAFGSTIAGRTG